MGNLSSKAQSMPSTPNKSFGATALTRSEGTTDLPAIDPLLDPRSPNIDRTPLAVVLATERRIRQIIHTSVIGNVNGDAEPTTPANTMRRRLLRDLGYNYREKEMNLLDPRSPSAMIPRTPIAFAAGTSKNDNEIAAAIDDANTSQSFEYTECIEDASCRHFNEKISNITLDGYSGEVPEDGNNDSSMIKRKQYLETNFDVTEAIPETLPEVEENEADPRSPSLNVQRTPMVFAANTATDTAVAGAVVDDAETAADNDVAAIDNIMDNSMLDIVGPAFSSTPTATMVAIATPLRHKSNAIIITKQKNLIYEDETDAVHSLDKLAKKSVEEFIPMTPVQKFHQRDGDKRVRTPLSVINRRTKSAENLSSKHSRIRAIDENHKMNENINLSIRKHSNENTTPKSSMIPLRMPLSQRNSVSKIPQLKRREV